MSKLREIIRDERRRRHGSARGPLVMMTRIVKPVLSGDRVVGSRQTGAFATIMGAKCDRIWQQRGESLEGIREAGESRRCGGRRMSDQQYHNIAGLRFALLAQAVEDLSI